MKTFLFAVLSIMILPNVSFAQSTQENIPAVSASHKIVLYYGQAPHSCDTMRQDSIDLLMQLHATDINVTCNSDTSSPSMSLVAEFTSVRPTKDNEKPTLIASIANVKAHYYRGGCDSPEQLVSHFLKAFTVVKNRSSGNCFDDGQYSLDVDILVAQ